MWSVGYVCVYGVWCMCICVLMLSVCVLSCIVCGVCARGPMCSLCGVVYTMC